MKSFDETVRSALLCREENSFISSSVNIVMIIERTRLKEKLQSETYGTNSTRFNFRRQVKR